MEQHTNRNKIIIAVSASVSLLLLILFIVRPGVIGYTVYQEVKATNYSLDDYLGRMQTLKQDLVVAQFNVSSCNDLNEGILDKLDNYTKKFYDCQSERRVLEATRNLSTNHFEEDIVRLQAEIDRKDEELDTLKSEKDEELAEIQDQYDLLAQNAANNLCCKAKVDNPSIRFFDVVNNRIVCLTTGSLNISC